MFTFSKEDLKKLKVYQEAKEEGKEEGREEGLSEAVKKLVQSGMDPQQVAQILELDPAQIHQALTMGS